MPHRFDRWIVQREDPRFELAQASRSLRRIAIRPELGLPQRILRFEDGGALIFRWRRWAPGNHAGRAAIDGKHLDECVDRAAHAVWLGRLEVPEVHLDASPALVDTESLSHGSRPDLVVGRLLRAAALHAQLPG